MNKFLLVLSSISSKQLFPAHNPILHFFQTHKNKKIPKREKISLHTKPSTLPSKKREINRAIEIENRRGLTLVGGVGPISTETEQMDARLLLPLLLALLDIKFNPKEVSPFDTHPVVMAFLVFDLIVYGIALMKEKEPLSEVHKILVNRICHMTSTLAAVLLVILLFRDLGWPLLVLWIVWQAWKTYKSYEQNRLALAGFFGRGTSDDAHVARDGQNQQPVGRLFLWEPLMLVTDCFS